MFLAAGRMLGQAGQCTPGLVIKATRLLGTPSSSLIHRVRLFRSLVKTPGQLVDQDKKTFLVWMSSLASYYFTNPMS